VDANHEKSAERNKGLSVFVIMKLIRIFGNFREYFADLPQ